MTTKGNEWSLFGYWLQESDPEEGFKDQTISKNAYHTAGSITQLFVTADSDVVTTLVPYMLNYLDMRQPEEWYGPAQKASTLFLR